MPPPESAHRNQKAVLWAADGFDDYGVPKVDAAVEIDVRWDPNQSEAVDPQGNTIAVDATVVVGQDIAIGSRMWLGTLEDYNALATAPQFMEVSRFDKTPNIKGRVFNRIVSLVNSSKELPTLNS